MKVLTVRNVNAGLAEGLRYLYREGIEEPSRNGPVLVAPGPVTTHYLLPQERVLFSPLRDANPFFHLFESLWMLAGRNDVAFPAQFAKQLMNYSDDGVTQRGAYGYRWRKWFGYDQLAAVVAELKRDPASRRVVIAMWDGGQLAYDACSTAGFSSGPGDLLATTADKPCNTHVYVDVRGGRLNITVCCRSNDIWWGAYGANAVHMSFLQEYLAAAVGIPMGHYHQVSNNYHIYTNVVPKINMQRFADDAELAGHAYKTSGDFTRNFVPLIQSYETAERFDDGLKGYLEDPAAASSIFFLNAVARPMYRSWVERKAKVNSGLQALRGVQDSYWFTACKEWIERRQLNRAKIEEEKRNDLGQH